MTVNHKKNIKSRLGSMFWAVTCLELRPRLHEQIKPLLIAQILDPYGVTPEVFGQIKHVLANKCPLGHDYVSKTWEMYLTRGHLFDSEGHLFDSEGHLFEM